jgi:hypothetical protein
MSDEFWRRLRAALAAIALGFLAASPAAAETYVGASGGAMVPYEGGVGWTLVGEIGTDWASKWFRLGAEFVFSDLDQPANLTWVGLPSVTVEMRTYEINFIGRYVLFPGHITPYVGAGGGFILVDVNDSALQRALGVPLIFQTGSSTGIGGGLLGLVGLEIPLFSKAINVYVEARADYYWEFTDNLKPLIDEKNYSGFSGIGGLRVRF